MLRAAYVIAIALASLYAGVAAGLAAGVIALLLGAIVVGVSESVDRLGQLVAESRRQTALLERLADHQTTNVHRRAA